MARIAALALSIVLLGASGRLRAQGPVPPATAENRSSQSGAEKTGPARAAFRGDARPSFQITPLVQRFAARPGQRIKFTFEVQSLGKPQSLRIRAVALQQQLNGLVVADDSAPPGAAMQLAAPEEVELKANSTFTVQGYIDVPRSPAPFHAYGILVTDLGRPLNPDPQSEDNKAGISVQFVTQFLLRVEVEVKGARPEDAKGLRIESPGLVDQDGQPVVEVDIANSSDTGVEFQLYCRLFHPDGLPAMPAFGLSLPVRAGRPVPDRYESIVYAKSRVRLVGEVPEPIFPGEYTLEFEWLSHGRKCGKVTTRVQVREGDFAAQAAKFAHVARALRVTPPQVALSLARGGTRRFPLNVANHSSRPLAVRLVARNADGSPANWVVVQPSDVLLPMKRERNVLVTARVGQNLEAHHYGVLHVEVSSSGTIVGTHDLPLALLGATPDEPQLVTGPMRWEADNERPAFVLPVENLGPVHLPLSGRLSFIDASGRKVEVSGGFERWLLPGSRDEVRFPLHHRLPQGMFPVKIQIETGQSEPRIITQQVNVE